MALMPPRVPMPSTGWDKVNHVLAFAVLALLGCRSYPRRAALVLSGLLAYGGAIELLQAFTGYRAAEWLDLAADGAGLSFGWLLTYARARMLRVK
ncbi:MAG: VanZ family protein [Comamonadaceae bacterium]|nr:MAG: VanZ family protein [Comamonadaceae bacterium]